MVIILLGELTAGVRTSPHRGTARLTLPKQVTGKGSLTVSHRDALLRGWQQDNNSSRGRSSVDHYQYKKDRNARGGGLIVDRPPRQRQDLAEGERLAQTTRRLLVRDVVVDTVRLLAHVLDSG